jgi:ATP-dependent helicase/DNAse subunit B
MAITLITGPANAGKAQLIIDEFCVHSERGSEPILVLPNQADVEHYGRELAERGVTVGARVRRFDGLIEEIAKRCRCAPRMITEHARRLILEGLAREQRELPRATPGYLHALDRFVAELESEHVTAPRLRVALNIWADSAQAIDREHLDLLGGVYDDYLALLERLGWADPQRYAALALDALREQPARWRDTPVMFYGFDDLTALQLDAIETLGVIVDTPVSVSLAYEPGRVAFAGRAGAFQTLLPLVAEHTQLQARDEHYHPRSRKALHHLERSLFEGPRTRVDPAGRIRLLEGGGERAELELVAQEIAGLLDRGVPPAEVAVVHRSHAQVAPLLGEVFRSIGIPYALERPQPFADTAIGAGLLGLLRCALGLGEALDLLKWLRTPGLIERIELVDRLELQLRRTGESGAQRARELWESEHWPLDSIDHLREAAGNGPLALIARLEGELERLFSGPRRRRASVLEEDELDEARGLARARKLLGELRELARQAPWLASTPEALLHTMQTLQYVGGETATPDRVVICSPLGLRARRVRALFVCALQEGVFPAGGPAEPLLTGEQRRSLAESSGLRLPIQRDVLASERYLFYACVSRPLELLMLSWHTTSDDGAASTPSLFIEDVCDLFDESLRQGRTRRAPGGAEPQPAGEPARIQDLSDPRLLEELREQTIFSASALETWHSCPVRWFVERLLRGKDIEPDPEPLARGGLAHAALKDTLEQLRAQLASARLTPDSLPLALRLLRAALEHHAQRFVLSVASERLPGARRRLQADLERYLRRAAEAESPLEPSHLELAFGFPEEGESPVLDLGEGLRLRGRIDRIDVGEDGAVVYDYKGRNAPAAAKWIDTGSFQVALYMRAAEQLLGLRVLGGFYQPLAGRDLKPRGALSSEAPQGLEHVRGDRLEHTDFTALISDAVRVARQAATEIGTGVLEPRPSSCDYQGGCRYPTICRCES